MMHCFARSFAFIHKLNCCNAIVYMLYNNLLTPSLCGVCLHNMFTGKSHWISIDCGIRGEQIFMCVPDLKYSHIFCRIKVLFIEACKVSLAIKMDLPKSSLIKIHVSPYGLLIVQKVSNLCSFYPLNLF